MNTSALAPLSNRSQRGVGDAYLKFYVDEKTPAVVAMKHVQEVLTLPPQRLTAMPNMPTCVLGLMSRRSRVMWAISLATMLEMASANPNIKAYNLMILRIGPTPLGVVVQRVEGIQWVDPNSVESPYEAVTPGLLPYLKGCILQPKEVLLVLDAEAIVQSPILHNH
ncbi:purine-binding chemotaxis protein CheW [Oculatella sp. LEGE 06141]|uniref:chemotaxis protein CheW n=1 Tax=Oculatella sp. LEGE 06141 TaxID=1828648 RepID=UPI001880B8AF|nr:chemotaxis protein CheW [Oculatella sp. LEGE 06141]MBE9182934.1 purine-binding chemotaxis protein CheW [Oculatella sp. LEGE 06141]